MHYVDGFVIAISKANLDNYKKMAELGARIWKKHGAVDYKECVGDDMSPSMEGMESPEHGDMGKMGTFPALIQAKPDEVVIFSFIVFNSKEHRDEVNAKVMADPEMAPDAFKDMPMPFEMNRMFYGGFQTIVQG